MTGTTYKVRVYDIQKRYRQGDTAKTRPSRYVVRWSVNGTKFDQSFKHSAQAKGPASAVRGHTALLGEMDSQFRGSWPTQRG
jgi:hypothetical protein